MSNPETTQQPATEDASVSMKHLVMAKCKRCEKNRAYRRDYYAKNREAFRKYQRKYYQENLETIREYHRNRYAEKNAKKNGATK